MTDQLHAGRQRKRKKSDLSWIRFRSPSCRLGLPARFQETLNQERFVADFSGASALAADDEAAHELLVEYGSELIALRIKPGANILAGVLEPGIAVPYGCG